MRIHMLHLIEKQSIQQEFRQILNFSLSSLDTVLFKGFLFFSKD